MHQMKAQMLILLVCSCLVGDETMAQTTPPRLLLVCGIESTLTTLSQAEVRKLFLGVPIDKNNLRLKPLRNASDVRLTEVFLQKVIFMSKREYDRQLVSRVFRSGGKRPSVFNDIMPLIAHLQAVPGTLTYMWSDQVEGNSDLNVIGVLWDATIN